MQHRREDAVLLSCRRCRFETTRRRVARNELSPDQAHFEPEAGASAAVRYGEGGPTIDYDSRGGCIRVVFDRWDSLRVSRGEYPAYPAGDHHERWCALGIVRPSGWLNERYEYEREHYGEAYGFGDDVTEMLTEFEHYLFKFHDEFVEVIAGGVHFDLADEPPR